MTFRLGGCLNGAGIKQIKGKTVDFGASDMPLTDADLAESGLIQFPTVIGGVVPVVNIKGIKPGQIRLSGKLLGDIYLGKITKWNDEALTALNPASSASPSGASEAPKSTVLALICRMPAPEPTDW